MWGYENDTRRYELDAKAIFGELYWDVNQDLRLTFGARYSDETKKSKQRTIYVTFADLPPLDSRTMPTASQSMTRTSSHGSSMRPTTWVKTPSFTVLSRLASSQVV